MSSIKSLLTTLFIAIACICAAAEGNNFPKTISDFVEKAKTVEFPTEPFPVKNIDLMGVPVMTGFSSPSMNQIFDMLAMSTYWLKNKHILKNLDAQACAGDWQAMATLFVFADRVATPTIRTQFFKRYAPIAIEKLPRGNDPDFKEKIKKFDSILLYFLCKWCEKDLREVDENFPVLILESCATSVDAAFRMQVDYYVRTKNLRKLNPLIRSTRASGSPERNLLLDYYATREREITDWRCETENVVTERFHQLIHKGYPLAMILWRQMLLDANKFDEADYFLKQLQLRYVFDVFPQMGDKFSKDDSRRAFLYYVHSRQKFSLDSLGELYDSLVASGYLEGAHLVRLFVQKRGANPAGTPILVEPENPADFEKWLSDHKLESEEFEDESLIELAEYLAKYGFFQAPTFEKSLNKFFLMEIDVKY